MRNLITHEINRLIFLLYEGVVNEVISLDVIFFTIFSSHIKFSIVVSLVHRGIL